MCGITGWFESRGASPDSEILERMTKRLAHRGPDGQQHLVQRAIGLGHARLRVIDLSERADQPMRNQEGRFIIVFNGEIYNFQQLRDSLESDGISFRTNSDTEVVLELFAKHGPDCLSQLEGMFAFAVWDNESKRLFVARDRAGQKPLFYYKDSQRFIFGSEIKAILAHPEVPCRPNLAALDEYLTFGYFPAPATPYESIRQLPPASWMLIGEGDDEATVHRYWTPPYETNGIRTAEEAEHKLDKLMRQAVRRRLIADVPLGAFLSGGVDSTLVVGLMSDEMSQPVRTFSIGFLDAPEYDETSYAEQAAEQLGTEHTTLKLEPPSGEHLVDLVDFHDGPFGDSSAIPTYAVSALARQHVTVVLNGDGGDELFAGYSRHAAAALAERVPWFVRRMGAALSPLIPESNSYAHPMRKAKRLLENTPLPLGDRIRTWCSYFNTDELEQLRAAVEVSKIRSHFGSFLSEASDATPLSKLLYLNYCTYLPEDLLVKVDRMSMAHSLEARSPFLDRDLVEFAGSLPDALKLKRFETKHILKHTYRSLLPKATRTRSKMGFGVPLGRWFRNQWRPAMNEYLGDRSSSIYEFIQFDPTQRFMNEHFSEKRDRGQQLFCLLTLAIWMERFR